MRFILFVLTMLLAGHAFAQPPQEIIASDTIELQPGESRMFMFNEPVAQISLSADGIVQVAPDSDRAFSFRALNSGTVLMTAYAPDGHIVHRSNLYVAGHMVKIYGFSRDDTKDFISSLCTSTGCGRADPDSDKPSSSSIATTHRKQNGDLITRTKNY